MKLPAEIEIIPGYYMVTYDNGHGVVVEDPQYDAGNNVIEAKKVAIDGIDEGGGTCYLSLDSARVFEPIGLDKLAHAKMIAGDKANSARIAVKLDLIQLLERGRQAGIVQGGEQQQVPQPAPERGSGMRPTSTAPHQGVPAPE